ncbi:MAG: hypothetical protein OXD50_11315 [Chloroflexi bacterium]|nr:hypothetical protein [Chloroflexota bacterium]
MLRRTLAILTLGAAALVTTAAAPDVDAAERAMLDAFDAALTAVAYAASGLALFGLVWAGFLLMADGAEGRSARGRSAVFLTVAGLAIALSAKGLAALISAGVIPIPIP